MCPNGQVAAFGPPRICRRLSANREQNIPIIHLSGSYKTGWRTLIPEDSARHPDVAEVIATNERASHKENRSAFLIKIAYATKRQHCRHSTARNDSLKPALRSLNRRALPSNRTWDISVIHACAVERPINAKPPSPFAVTDSTQRRPPAKRCRCR